MSVAAVIGRLQSGCRDGVMRPLSLRVAAGLAASQ
jgi:hypothetical protein